jgi:hypothetical protein
VVIQLVNSVRLVGWVDKVSNHSHGAQSPAAAPLKSRASSLINVVSKEATSQVVCRASVMGIG